MDTYLMKSTEIFGKFCRLHMRSRQELPIRSSEMGVLIFIGRQGKEVTPLMISDFFTMSKPSVTPILNRLIKEALVIKVPSKEDRRSYHVQITKKGKSLVDDTFEYYAKTISLLEEKMGKKRFYDLVTLLEEANEVLEGEKRA